MNRIFKIICWVLMMMCGYGAYAQTVSNVTAEQVGKTIHVSYDLDKAADISLFVSMDGGGAYTQLYKVKGNVGKTIGPGHKTIVWDVQSEVKELNGDNIVFKIKVDANAEIRWRKQLREEAKKEEDERKANEMAKEKEAREREKTHAMEVKADKKEEKEKKEKTVLPYSTFTTLNAAYSPLPQWSYGFKVGGMKRVGWFVSVMSNFNFAGWGSPFQNNYTYYLTGKSKTIRFSAQAGFVYRPCKPISILLGVGYGYRTLTYRIFFYHSDGTYKNSAWRSLPLRTYHGADVSLGLLFDIKGFALSAEAVTTNFQTIETRIGVGFCLPHKTSPKSKPVKVLKK